MKGKSLFTCGLQQIRRYAFTLIVSINSKTIYIEFAGLSLIFHVGIIYAKACQSLINECTAQCM